MCSRRLSINRSFAIRLKSGRCLRDLYFFSFHLKFIDFDNSNCMRLIEVIVKGQVWFGRGFLFVPGCFKCFGNL